MSDSSSQLPQVFEDALLLADKVIEHLDGKIVLGLPLGLGKANLIANALYERASGNPEIDLTILTALTLEVPHGSSRLEKRFIDPISQRLFKDYPEPLFPGGLRRGTLSPNIRVHEFFVTAGQWMNVTSVQQNYISSNYTHAAATLIDRGLNVIAQMVAPSGDGSNAAFSMSCNADLTPDLLKARAAGEADFLMLGEVNNALPYMMGDAELARPGFDYLLQGTVCQYPLFAPPKPTVALADYAAGFWISRLIADGGTLQIGIGSIGDGVAQALILRQQHNPLYCDTVARLAEKAPDCMKISQDTPFSEGLFGVSEMLVDVFIPLIDAGVIKREVDGALVHAAFFLGPQAFYQRLNDLSDQQRQKIQMKPVSWVNSLYRDEQQKRKQRLKARFINNAMMATLLGAIVSDGLEDGRVVSGVGGQYDFVAQAFALDGARSIIALNATRQSRGGVRSNIVWSYGHQTIPRHLRDIVVTEYGVADLRNKTDSEVIVAMLAITDSRFQAELLAQARQSGKIATGFSLPEHFGHNTPDKVVAALEPVQLAGFLPAFPFGSDFTDVEIRLMPALKLLSNSRSSRLKLMAQMLKGSLTKVGPYQVCLQRLSLEKPASLADWAYRFLMLYALDQTR
jgi:hypothetical protein